MNKDFVNSFEISDNDPVLEMRLNYRSKSPPNKIPIGKKIER